MDLGIAGKWALVCGASKGLGHGCAQALAREGVNVVLVARRAEVLFFALRQGARAAAPCAPLCLALDWTRLPGQATHRQDGVARLRVDILKRRGPPLLAPLELPAFNPVLQALLALDGHDGRSVLEPAAGAAVLRFPQPAPYAAKGRAHALDRLAMAV